MPAPDALIQVGKITGTHGIKGLLKVHAFSGSIDSLKRAESVLVQAQDGTLQEFRLRSIAPHAGKFTMGLQGLDDINLVLSLVGRTVCLYRSQLPQTDEDEYYWCDLIGLAVETVDGQKLGTIAEIFEAGSSDIYVVRGGGREYLIPAIADVINRVDLAGGIMIITPLEGLLDL